MSQAIATLCLIFYKAHTTSGVKPVGKYQWQFFQFFGGEENEEVQLFHYCRGSIVN